MSSAPESIALHCTGVEKSFDGSAVLAGVDLAVVNGSITSLLGPSGGGKTTLLRLIAGFDYADRGLIAVHGVPVDGVGRPVPPHRRQIGCVPQEGALFPHLSVGGNVGFGLPRGGGRRERIAECLDLVGLPGIEGTRPHELSGGQQQRVALARALAPRPKLILLDEPFAALDAGLRSQVRDEVCAALRRAGATALIVTHDQQEALSVADSVAVLLDGRVRQHADPVSLYRRPADLDVGRFVGEAIVLDGRLADGVAECALGRVEANPQGHVGASASLLIRPEQLRIVDRKDGRAATVVDRTFLGPQITVDLRIAGTDSPIRASANGNDLPELGAEVGLIVDGAVCAYHRDGHDPSDMGPG